MPINKLPVSQVYMYNVREMESDVEALEAEQGAVRSAIVTAKKGQKVVSTLA